MQKRILSFLLIAVLTFGLSACSSGNVEDVTSEPTTSEVTTVETTPEATTEEIPVDKVDVNIAALLGPTGSGLW